MIDPGIVPADALTSLAFGIIKILGYGAVGIVVFGFLLSGLYDFFECRKWKRCHLKRPFRIPRLTPKGRLV